MGTIEGWQTRRKKAEQTHTQQIDAAYNLGLGRGYENGRASLADLIGQLQAIAVTAEKLCKVDGSKIGRMYYFDAQKAMEHSERLHELLTEWRKGQKEKRW